MTQKQELYFSKQPLPNYSKGEEVFNLASHAAGGGISIIMLIVMMYLAIKKDLHASETIALAIYGVCAICLYTMSSLYHGLKKELVSKKVFRIIDHCTIYILIAGTYTPICVIALKGSFQGMFILLTEWLCAILGITLNALWLNNKKVQVISNILYIVTGWLIVFVPNTISMLTNLQFLYILLGGIMYSVGVIFYGAGSKKKWAHSIFHIFCVLGTIIQFIGIYLMII